MCPVRRNKLRIMTRIILYELALLIWYLDVPLYMQHVSYWGDLFTSNFELFTRHVAVGNEPFLSAYNGSFVGTTLPALRNI